MLYNNRLKNLQSNVCKKIQHSYYNSNWQPWIRQSVIINDLIQSRNLFDIQKIQYDLMSVYSMDIDPNGNFLLIGLSNGSIDIQEISDPCNGNLEQISYIHLTASNIHRVQWFPGNEQFFTALDNHTMHLFDPNELRIIEEFPFRMNASWSEWNPNDKEVIAVCGSESQVRLVDLRAGSSTQSLILSAPSRMPTHRATRCLWSKTDTGCLFVSDNEGYIHVFDVRHPSNPIAISEADFLPQISGLSFTNDQKFLITSHGTDNQLVQWSFDKCKLVPDLEKFRKRKPQITEVQEPVPSTSTSSNFGGKLNKSSVSRKKTSGKTKKTPIKKSMSLPDTTYLRCQFHISDKLICCPVPNKVRKSKELYIYDLESGNKIKTLQSDEILSSGIYTVAGLLPDSLVLYVGGKNRIRVWSLDEDHQRKIEEKMKKFHTDHWDSD